MDEHRFTHRTGRVPVEFHQFLIRAQDLRNAGDDGQLNAVTAQQANEQITRAEQFLELAQNLIGVLPPNSQSGVRRNAKRDRLVKIVI